MPAITSAMATAKDAQAEADRSADAAREVCAELKSTAVNVKEELHEMRAQLAEFTANARETVEPGERLMREFAKQADTFARELQVLRQRSNSIDKHVQQAMDVPSRTLVEAQAQAARLERVCGSVRKVFAELSRASLDANKQAQACRQVSDDANMRLTTLAGENDRAIGTLSEWVEEATRVHSRLERLVVAIASCCQVLSCSIVSPTGVSTE